MLPPHEGVRILRPRGMYCAIALWWPSWVLLASFTSRRKEHRDYRVRELACGVRDAARPHRCLTARRYDKAFTCTSLGLYLAVL